MLSLALCGCETEADIQTTTAIMNEPSVSYTQTQVKTKPIRRSGWTKKCESKTRIPVMEYKADEVNLSKSKEEKRAFELSECSVLELKERENKLSLGKTGASSKDKDNLPTRPQGGVGVTWTGWF